MALDMPISFAKPQWLWLLLLIPALVLPSIRALAGIGPVRRVVALVMRSLVVLVVAVTLAEVQRVRRNEDLTVIFLMDRSLSVGEHLDAQERYMEAVCKEMEPRDRAGVISFARGANLEQLPMEPGPDGGYYLQRGRLPELANPERTNVAAAIRHAMAFFPHDTAKRIILMSDGNDNMGDVLGEARRAKADGIVIDVAPLFYTLQNEIYFDKLVAPDYAESGEVQPIRMNIHSNRHASGRIDFYHNGRKIDLPDEIAHKNLVPGNNAFILKLPIQTDGVQRFEARFIPDNPDMDSIPGNNVATDFSFVSARGKVAILTMNPEHDRVLQDALRSENIKVTMVDVSLDVPDLVGMLDYSAIILANVPANVFTDQQQRSLAEYVENMGGGLIMTGGDESFGAGGWIGTPVADILPVELELKHKRIIPRGALVLILHSCEIPRGNFWGKEIAKKSVDTISSRDYLGIVAYAARGESWEVPLGLATNKAAIKARIDRMMIGDMPDFDTTMRMALNALRATDAAQKHIIMISDGDPSFPAANILKGLVAAKITCSTIGIGYGSHVKEQPLRKIAKQTGGRFYAVRNPRRLPQIFVKESKVVRRPLIIDEPFPPQVYYRLSDLLTGIADEGGLPSLGGLVLTSPKPLAQLPLVRATTDGKDPVLAHWQRGLGKVVAFTSGYWPKWGTQWTQWPKFSKLWAQIVRWTMRQDAPANFATYTTQEGNEGRIIVEALDKDARYLNFLQLQASLIHPTEGPKHLQFVQTGPGHYEAKFDIDQTGQYVANVAVFENGEYRGSIHAGISMPFSPEYRELATNEALLREVANITDGRWLALEPEHDDVFAHNLPPTVSKRPAWDWTLAWLLLPLFLLDVAARRLASWLALSIVVELAVLVFMLWGLGLVYESGWAVLGCILLAELIGWTIRFRYIGPLFNWLTHTSAVLAHTGERTTAALEQLKSVKDRIRDDTAGQIELGAPATEPKRVVDKKTIAPTADRRTRFVAEEQPGITTAKDLREALGGAGATPSGKKEPTTAPSTAPDQAESEEATTSRLLRAKRRAQRKQGDPDNEQHERE